MRNDNRDTEQERCNPTVVVPAVVEPRLDTDTLPPHPQTSAKERRFAFGILMLSILCLGLGQTILFAVLPPIARQIGIPDIQVGIIFTFSAICWVISSTFWGRRSDLTGRKPIILLGVGAFAISIAALGIVMELGARGITSVFVTFYLLFFLRSIHGSFASAAPAAGQAYVADRTNPDERTSSLASMAAAFGIGATLGPGIGSATARFGPMVPLLVVATIAIIVFIFRFLFVFIVTVLVFVLVLIVFVLVLI
ncbi:MAG: MFS transporter, partial [Pseudomonadota bacterium]